VPKKALSMNENIEAIFLDIGNTLRILLDDPPHRVAARRKITELLGTGEDPEIFCQKLDTRYKTYRKWAFENLAEAPEAELWTRWLAPDFPAEKVAPLGVELTFQYRQSMGRRVVVESGKEVVVELHRRGYILGIISNLITSREIPDWMEADGFRPYFKSVVLSSVLGRRKPDPEVFLEAARQAGVEPERCVYVGDNPKRDVIGARQAGFGAVVLIIDPARLDEKPISNENRPDLVIHNFSELLKIFSARESVNLRP
jgi:HAD superfamily hydrolase (TIGR01549 family)